MDHKDKDHNCIGQFIKSRKAEGLSITVIVIAAVALFVLIILILIFSGKLDLFNKGIGSCPPNAPAAFEEDLINGMCPGNKLPAKIVSDKETGRVQYCCVSPAEESQNDDESRPSCRTAGDCPPGYSSCESGRCY